MSMCALMSAVFRGLLRSWPFYGVWVTSGRQGVTEWTGIFAPLTFLVYLVLFAVFWLMSGAYMIKRSWIRETIVKARVLPCLGTCSGWGLLRMTKMLLGIMTHVSTSVCTCPTKQVQALMRLRVCSWNLEVYRNTARARSERERVCKKCSAGKPEDEYHVVLICDVYNDLRSSTVVGSALSRTSSRGGTLPALSKLDVSLLLYSSNAALHETDS